jgi:putative tryptophan/tyrosine transport system substrate-binding protein
MRRRDFIRGIAGSATVWSLTARAQQGAMPVIGFLSSLNENGYGIYLEAFRQGLGETGFSEDRNVQIEYRFAEGQYDRLPGLAADLVGRHVSVIFAAGGNPPAQAAKSATDTIPIVFVSGGDPVAGRIVPSFSRPGGNVTGISWFATELTTKRLELLHRLAIGAGAIGALVNPTYEDAELQLRELEQAGAPIKQTIKIVRASTAQELVAAFASLAQQGVAALIVANDPFFAGHRDQIVALATRYAVPTIYFLREFTAAGGLMSYGASLTEANRQGGVYVGKVLNGAKPADLPVWRPTKFELAINLKTAKALGLVIPPSVLSVADEVIE